MTLPILPPGLLHSLALLPTDTPIVGLIRHAEREPFVPGDINNDVNLTLKGEMACYALTYALHGRLIKVFTSPVKRCLQTAHLLATASISNEIISHHYLGDPGIFITEQDKVHAYFLEHTVFDIVKTILSEQRNPPGFCLSTQASVANLIQFMLAEAIDSGIYLFITHDSILSVALGHLFPNIALETLWPDYLECLFFWQARQSLYGAYRNLCKPIAWN